MKKRDFFGREVEVKILDEMYKTNKFEFICIYGRRRVGKSTIIHNWSNDSNIKIISFTAIEFNNNVNLLNFSKAIFETFPEGQEYIDCFDEWSKAFDYIAKQMSNHKVVLVIDEYPYLAQSAPSIPSILQKYIDTVFLDTNLKLILCGSSMSFMKNQVMGYQSPLYGRRTYQMEIKPFDYYQTSLMRNYLKNDEKFLLYAVTGGIPHYVNLLLHHDDQEPSLNNGILKAFFTNSGSLYEEPTNLIKQELREPAMYNSVIQAIATGATKLNEVASLTKEPTSKINRYIEVLSDLYIIRKESAILNETKRKATYNIIDNMFNFWYRFVSNNIHNIERNKGKRVFDKVMIDESLNEYLGKIFERASIDYLLNNDELFIEFENIGRWWGNNPLTKKEEEIDIVGYNRKQILFAECKYSNKLTDIDVYEKLVLKSQILNQADKQHSYVIFSKNGFTEKLINLSNSIENLKLINLDDMYK